MKIVWTLLIVAGLAFPALAQTEGDVRVKVTGMVCDFCARNIEKVFSKEQAVEGVDVDLGKKIVSLSLKPDASLSDQKITELVKAAGYNVVSISRGGEDAAK